MGTERCVPASPVVPGPAGSKSEVFYSPPMGYRGEKRAVSEKPLMPEARCSEKLIPWRLGERPEKVPTRKPFSSAAWAFRPHAGPVADHAFRLPPTPDIVVVRCEF